jgi:hypothetical protein
LLIKSDDTIALILLNGSTDVIKSHFIDQIITLMFGTLKIQCLQPHEFVSSLSSSVVWKVSIRVLQSASTTVDNHWDEYSLSIDRKGLYRPLK